VIHDGMPCDLIQGQVQDHGGLQYAKMVDFKGYLLRQYVIKRLMVNYDTPGQYI